MADNNEMKTDHYTMKTDSLMNVLNYDDLEKEADSFILDSAAAVVVDDESGKIIRVTREVEEALGYLENELLGETLEILIPDTLRAQHVKNRTSQAGMAITRQMNFGRPVQARMKDGRERQVTISLKSKFRMDRSTGEKQRWTRASLIFAPLE